MRATPFAPRAVLLQQNQSPPPVGAPAPGANTCPPHSHRGGAPTTKPNPTPTRRGTRPGCECVPDPFAPRAVLLQPNQTQLRPVGAPAPGANACPPVRTEAVLLRGPLQPNRIPMRIIPHRFHQPRPDRVGYDISGQRLEVILPAHCPIMKTPLPYAPPDSPRTNTPHPPHHSAEGLVIQLHQPMEMIRHHDIAPGLNTVLQRLHTQGIDQNPGIVQVGENRFAFLGNGGNEVQPASLGHAPKTQTVGLVGCL